MLCTNIPTGRTNIKEYICDVLYILYICFLSIRGSCTRTGKQSNERQAIGGRGGTVPIHFNDHEGTALLIMCVRMCAVLGTHALERMTLCVTVRLML